MCSVYEEVRARNGEVCFARDPMCEVRRDEGAMRRAMRPVGSQTCEARRAMRGSGRAMGRTEGRSRATRDPMREIRA
jgi:hypothetical protein